MRHVYMRASMDIWRTRSMNKEGDSPDCECYGRLRSNRPRVGQSTDWPDLDRGRPADCFVSKGGIRTKSRLTAAFTILGMSGLAESVSIPPAFLAESHGAV